MEELLDSLTEREANILRKRMGFYGGKLYTVEEIGLEFNVTKERIRQIEVKALSRLKKIIEIKKWDIYDLML
ncbi:sigma factor-like helix-turn-helix DNA-binding protein [Bacillus infantis]|uniref:sigma factor-like helix-turn-helix DNA-binding protein n=1 Tax=Bacillus infantis TaxID=324767 RepID=UPI0020A06096|nr:sigma factor-like helix-turn-helix DNA-binding protein [Bacillus infantis]MCP1157006.1 hypothetical protein [Bacillus infantis]